MHPIGWAQSTGVAKIAHGRASLKRQLRQNTRIFGPLGKLMRIRIFIYLPPKAGFNWRGPARR